MAADDEYPAPFSMPSVGDVSHNPSAPTDTTTAPAPFSAPPVGGTGDGTTPPARPGFMGSMWQSITNIPQDLWQTGTGAYRALTGGADDRAAFGAGVVRGARDFWDKVNEQPMAPEVTGGVADPRSAADLDKVRQQNIADRTAAETKWGGNPSFNAGRTVGNVVGSAPATAPLGLGLGMTLRALPLLGPAIESAGVPGIAGRTAERIVQGGVGGGTQAAATSDPTQPLGPQIAAGVGGGAVLGSTTGWGSDILSNAIKRLRGTYVPQTEQTPSMPLPGAPPPSVGANPPLGPPQVPAITVERANNAQTLLRENVPVYGPQVSNDPYMGALSKYGGMMPGAGTDAAINNQAASFRGAVLQRIAPGTPARTASTDFIANNETRIDGQYSNSVGAVTNVPSILNGQPMNQSLAQIRAAVPQALGADAIAKIDGAIGDVNKAFAPGQTVTGTDAQSIVRSTNSTLSPLLNDANPDVRRFGMQIRDQVNQRLRSQMTPDQQTLFDNTNSQYRALKTVQAVTDSNGSFTPGDLNTEAGKVTERYGNAGTLDGLARAGDSIIQPSLDARGGAGRYVGGGAAALSPVASAVLVHQLLGPAIDLATSGGAGTALATGLGVVNRAAQDWMRRSGPRAAETARTGGGTPVMDLPAALQLLRYGPLAASVGQGNQPTSQ